MPSIPGYQYDIFVSYRQKDNRSDQWVTTFVQALREELDATFKEEISIYFDANAHDGLLETHDVDSSLKEKIKCIILIPIVSQTYCDPKSFAWQKEFLPFIDFARHDPYGLDIQLANGNVAKRVLPVRIHDIDDSDKRLFEEVIQGVMRPVDFIYKESGVNRPLKANDERTLNLHKIDYGNQVNKLANAIKEIINGLKTPNSPTEVISNPIKAADQLRSGRKRKFSVPFIIVAILLGALIGYLVYPKAGNADTGSVPIENSIAVLPFVDLSELNDQEWFSDGLSEELLNSLTHIENLKVISRTSSFAFKNKNLSIQVIADSLHANYIVEGSVRKSPQGVRITAQLIRSKDGINLWSSTYDRNSKDIFEVQQDIATRIAEALNISLDAREKDKMVWAGTNNPDAFLAFLRGREYDKQAHNTEPRRMDLLKTANTYYEEGMRLDPDFLNLYLYHADYYLHYVLREDPAYQDTLSEVQARDEFLRDLDNAITHSKTTTQKDYYRILRVIYSDDWTTIRALIEKNLVSDDVENVYAFQNFAFTEVMIALGYGRRVYDIEKRIVAQGKYSVNLSDSVSRYIPILRHEGKYAELHDYILSVESFPDRFKNILLAHCLYSMNNVDKAYETLLNADSSVSVFHPIRAMILAARGEREKAHKELLRSDPLDGYYLQAVDKVLGREAANRIVSEWDSKLLLDFPLIIQLMLSPDNPPFDLSATPNLARRLKQAGPLAPQP